MADLTATVSEALTKQADNKTNDLSAADATKVTPAVAKAVNADVNAIITNLTNNEPWYKSRVFVGIFVSLAFKAAIAAGYTSDNLDLDSTTTLVLAIVSALGDAYAAYGRAVTNKPIGE